MNKIIALHSLKEYRNQYSKYNIVAACGCFDIIHIGHIEYLEGAKGLGDILFVGINSDASVIRNKGKRPVFQLMDRLHTIAALSCVDYVFSFSHKTFSESLRLLKPDIFARGTDAEYKSFPEKQLTQALDIKVVKIGEIKRSSSSLLRKYFEGD